MEGIELQSFIIDKIDDIKGQDIISIDVRGKSSITDNMIICTGTSRRHVMSIAEHIVESVKNINIIPLGVEGNNDAEWVVVDIGELMVHVMQDEARQRYELEKLWG